MVRICFKTRFWNLKLPLEFHVLFFNKPYKIQNRHNQMLHRDDRHGEQKIKEREESGRTRCGKYSTSEYDNCQARGLLAWAVHLLGIDLDGHF
jgi:hypothetical protein